MKRSTTLGPHGIDITAPGGVDALIAFHRQTFGDSRMEEGAGDGGNEGGDGGDGGQNPPSGTEGQPQNVEDLPDWAQRVIREARDDAARYRTGSEEAARTAAEEAQATLAQRIGEALGLVSGEGDEPTVEGLTTQVADLTRERDTLTTNLREAQISLAAYQRSGQHNADPAALLDSRSFLAKVADLDPSADGFQTSLDTVIKDVLKENPRLTLASQAGGSSSADHGAGGGTGQQGRPYMSLEQASANVLGRQG